MRAAPPTHGVGPGRLPYALVFGSGVAALLYELLWMRQLHLIFGVSSLAVASVLCAYMLGLALGSLVFGRLAERVRDPMRAYAAIELGIGLSALASQLALRRFHVVEQLYYEAYAEAGLYALSLVRMLLCLAILLLPTMLIGGTIPMITKRIVTSEERLGGEFGTIYYANAAGALMGVLLTGFVSVRWLGVSGSFLLAVAINLVIGVLAWTRPGAAPAARATSTTTTRAPMLVVFFATGFIVFGYELIWLRLISIYGRATTYSLAVVLAGFLAGIALGSAWFARRSARIDDLLGYFAGWALGSAGLGLGVLLGIGKLQRALELPGIYGMPLLPTLVELALGFLFSLAVSLPFGVLFPLSLHVYAGGPSRIGASTGSAYFVNTWGAICGSLATGFVLIPLLGLQRAALLLVLATLVLALVVPRLEPGGAAPRLRLAGAALLAAAAVGLMAFGETRHYKLRGPQDELIWYEEGLAGTVSVIEFPAPGGRYREILVDSEPVAATYPPDVIDAKLLAHIPLMLASSSGPVNSALTVGFGSGGTSHSMRRYGVEVTAVEIERAIVHANHLFQANSHGVLDDPGFRLVLDDARSFLLATRDRFDVIVTDVTNLKYKGNPSLYTVEYFELMRDKLAPGGIGAAWVPLGGESFRDLRILVASFRAVFPHTTIWFYSLETTHFLVFVGTPARLELDLDALTPPPGAREDLGTMGIRGRSGFASMLFMGEEDVERLAAGMPLHTDEHPVLEYSDMDFYLVSNSIDNLERLFDYKREDLTRYFTGSPHVIAAVGASLEAAEAKHRTSIRELRSANGGNP